MKNKAFLIILFWLITISGLLAQGVILKGIVVNAADSKPIRGATVKCGNLTEKTEKDGDFYFSLKPGVRKFTVTYSGYKKQSFEFLLKQDTSIVLSYQKIVGIKQVTVKGSLITEYIREPEPGITKIQPSKFDYLPAVLGDADVLKKIQYLPGIHSGNEGSSGLIVRGGSYEHNLINLNGFPVFQPYHLMGFQSAFDPFFVDEMEIIKGGFPSKYGGRLSSVININTKRNYQDTLLTSIYTGIMSIGGGVRYCPDSLTGITLTGKQSLLSTLLNFKWNPVKLDVPVYNFSDMLFDFGRKIDNNNHIGFLVFFNRDKAGHSTENEYEENGYSTITTQNINLDWFNLLSGISWSNTGNYNRLTTLRLYYQHYANNSNNQIIVEQEAEPPVTTEAINGISSKISEIGAVFDNEINISFRHRFNYGITANYRMYLPSAGTFLYINDVLQNRNDTIADNTQNNFSGSLYLEDNYTVNNKLFLRGGIRVSLIHASGKTWLIPEPRFTMSYNLDEKMSINYSWAITTQSIHRLTSSSVMQTSDLWVPSTQNTTPEISSLFVAGMKYRYNHEVLAGLELYYKKMYNLITYKDGATYMTEPYWENNIVYGEGKSKGVEVLFQKAGDKMFGLIAYTLSFTDVQFDEINKGEKFPFKYDKRHDFGLTIGYRPKEKLSLSCNWVLQSGKWVSIYDRFVPRQPIPLLESRNNVRFPLYHRLDLGLQLKKKKRWGTVFWKFDIYNAYSRLNPWYLKYSSGTFEQIALFPIIPSVCYSVRF